MKAKDFLNKIASDDLLLERARQAIEDTLIARRDSRISALRNNGLVIKESDGQRSDMIRMGPEEAVAIGLQTIAEIVDGLEEYYNVDVTKEG